MFLVAIVDSAMIVLSLGELFPEPKVAPGAPFVPGLPPQPSPDSDALRANYQKRVRGDAEQCSGSTLALTPNPPQSPSSAEAPEGVGNGLHPEGNHFPEASNSNLMPQPSPSGAEPSPPQNEAPASAPTAPVGSRAPSKSVYENGTYWKFLGLLLNKPKH